MTAPQLMGMTTSAFDPPSRFRFVQFIPHLERAGWRVTHRPNVPDRKWSSPLSGRIPRAIHHRLGRLWMKRNRWKDVKEAADYDVVFVNRDLAGRGRFFEAELLRRNPRVVFDFDDAIFLDRNEPAIRFMCKRAAWVTPGNRYLAGYVSRHTDHFTVIPTVIDTDIYQPIDLPPGAVVRVGWSGSDQSIRQTLIPHLPLLADIQRRCPFELVIITNTRPALDEGGLRWTFRAWTAEDEVAGLQSLDVGIMPLLDDEFQRGKCGLKALQYMAVGKPVVASPVGANAEIVERGQTGFWASNPAEWAQGIESLVVSRARREQFGRAGRERCLTHYSVSRWLPTQLEIFERVRTGAP